MTSKVIARSDAPNYIERKFGYIVRYGSLRKKGVPYLVSGGRAYYSTDVLDDFVERELANASKRTTDPETHRTLVDHGTV